MNATTAPRTREFTVQARIPHLGVTRWLTAHATDEAGAIAALLARAPHVEPTGYVQIASCG